MTLRLPSFCTTRTTTGATRGRQVRCEVRPQCGDVEQNLLPVGRIRGPVDESTVVGELAGDRHAGYAVSSGLEDEVASRDGQRHRTGGGVEPPTYLLDQGRWSHCPYGRPGYGGRQLRGG